MPAGSLVPACDERPELTTAVRTDVFDGMLVTLAMYTLNFMHPGRLLRATEQMQSSYALNSRTSSY